MNLWYTSDNRFYTQQKQKAYKTPL